MITLCFQFTCNKQALAAADINTNGGDDYSIAAGTVDFMDTDLVKPISVTIESDADIEETECFTLTLSNPTMGSLDNFETVTTICIKDDDSKYIYTHEYIFMYIKSPGFKRNTECIHLSVHDCV